MICWNGNYETVQVRSGGWVRESLGFSQSWTLLWYKGTSSCSGSLQWQCQCSFCLVKVKGMMTKTMSETRRVRRSDNEWSNNCPRLETNAVSYVQYLVSYGWDSTVHTVKYQPRDHAGCHGNSQSPKLPNAEIVFDQDRETRVGNYIMKKRFILLDSNSRTSVYP
jgi:hypothetical protein